jgi:adenine-specific DNA-methyltransferase
MARSRDISVEALRHKDKRRNIPTAELEPVMDDKDKRPVGVPYKRNRDLDPQLIWRGKDEQDWSDLIVQAPPLYIQEKVHPKVLIDDLLRQSKARRDEKTPPAPDLFGDFNGLPDREAVTEFYQHDANWSNRMILGDSLAVMASLAEREGLRGKVQCIYLDPPYGIRFNSNFQWSTTSRDVKDGSKDHITREPEQVKAFRDTWRDGIHSYLTYLRDRLTVARDLLADTGSIFVQIGDENVHRVRALMDEVFGNDNLVSLICLQKTGGQETSYIPNVADYVLWYAKKFSDTKYRQMYFKKALGIGEGSGQRYDRVQLASGVRRSFSSDEKNGDYVLPPGARAYQLTSLISSGVRTNTTTGWRFQGKPYHSGATSNWKTSLKGLDLLAKADRVEARNTTIAYVRFIDDFAAYPVSNVWTDVAGAAGKIYVVQTSATIVQRCILMTTDPGDLVLDPTCGSGTAAYVAEQWGRRWITIDTSRVALALARARIMGARYPYYLLADSPEGQRKEAEVSRTPPKETPTHNDIRHGFVYERVPHITLKSIANNAEIDVIWEKWQATLEPLRAQLNAALGRGASFETAASRLPQDEEVLNTPTKTPHAEERAQRASRSTHSGDAAKPWQEWEIPREAGDPWPESATKLWALARGDHAPEEIAKAIDGINRTLGRAYTRETLPDAPRDPWPEEATRLHADWWQARIARQQEIDASIAAKAEFEYLYDKPYPDNSRTRVAGPFTVESLSPHRYIPGDADDSLVHELAEPAADWNDFGQMVLENLKTAGVQQAHKEDRITFTALTPWPGKWIAAEGRYSDASGERRAAILMAPNSASSRAPTWSMPRARRPMPVSTW